VLFGKCNAADLNTQIADIGQPFRLHIGDHQLKRFSLSGFHRPGPKLIWHPDVPLMIERFLVLVEHWIALNINTVTMQFNPCNGPVAQIADRAVDL
jgi:hypothetical protein